MGYIVKGVSKFRSGYRAIFQEETGGPRVFRTLKSREKGSAAIEAELMAASGLEQNSGELSVGTVIENHLESVAENGSVTPDTLAGYRRVSRRVGPFGRTPVRNVSHKALQAYADLRLAEGAAPNSLLQEISLIRMSLKPYLSTGVIDPVCFKLLDLPARQLPGPTIPDPEESAVFLNTLGLLRGKVGIAARLAVETESLAAEVVGIRWEDLPKSCSTIVIRRRITRSGHVIDLEHQRRYSLPPALAGLLCASRDMQRSARCRRHYLLSGSDEPMKAVTLSKKFASLSDALGIKCSFNALKQLKNRAAA